LAKQRETLFKERALHELRSWPKTWVCKIQQVSKRGTPDILASIGGRFVALELKTDKGRISALQKYNLEKIEDTGAMAFVVSPKNYDSVLKTLRSLLPKQDEEEE
jgi:Holliday junction resolvase